jgi:hypothetical protein
LFMLSYMQGNNLLVLHRRMTPRGAEKEQDDKYFFVSHR